MRAESEDLCCLSRVEEITLEGVVATGPSSSMTIAAGTVVLAVGMKSEDGLYRKLLNKIAPLFAIGDCREPRNITGAVWDGYEVGRSTDGLPKNWHLWRLSGRLAVLAAWQESQRLTGKVLEWTPQCQNLETAVDDRGGCANYQIVR